MRAAPSGMRQKVMLLGADIQRLTDLGAGFRALSGRTRQGQPLGEVALVNYTRPVAATEVQARNVMSRCANRSPSGTAITTGRSRIPMAQLLLPDTQCFASHLTDNRGTGMTTRHRLAIVLSMALTSLPQALEAQVVRADLPEQVRGAAQIVVGVVVAVEPVLQENAFGDQLIVSHTTVEVQEVIKGPPRLPQRAEQGESMGQRFRG